MDCSPPGSSVHGDSPGKNTRVGCYDLLKGIFPAQGSSPHLLHHLGKWWSTRYISEKDCCCGCCLVTKLCPTLCDPMDYNTPGFPGLLTIKLESDSSNLFLTAGKIYCLKYAFVCFGLVLKSFMKGQASHIFIKSLS